jgi:hypothetical protein
MAVLLYAAYPATVGRINVSKNGPKTSRILLSSTSAGTKQAQQIAAPVVHVNTASREPVSIPKALRTSLGNTNSPRLPKVTTASTRTPVPGQVHAQGDCVLAVFIRSCFLVRIADFSPFFLYEHSDFTEYSDTCAIFVFWQITARGKFG